MSQNGKLLNLTTTTTEMIKQCKAGKQWKINHINYSCPSAWWEHQY